jgi:hypothetical protein
MPTVTINCAWLFDLECVLLLTSPIHAIQHSSNRRKNGDFYACQISSTAFSPQYPTRIISWRGRVWNNHWRPRWDWSKRARVPPQVIVSRGRGQYLAAGRTTGTNRCPCKSHSYRKYLRSPAHRTAGLVRRGVYGSTRKLLSPAFGVVICAATKEARCGPDNSYRCTTFLFLGVQSVGDTDNWSLIYSFEGPIVVDCYTPCA